MGLRRTSGSRVRRRPLRAARPDGVAHADRKTVGVQQAHKEDKITFTSLTPWPGELVCAEGRYVEGDAESGREKRAAILLGPEFWYRLPPRSRGRCARGGRRRLRCTHCLRLQLRRPFFGARTAGTAPIAQGPE